MQIYQFTWRAKVFCLPFSGSDGKNAILLARYTGLFLNQLSRDGKTGIVSGASLVAVKPIVRGF